MKKGLFLILVLSVIFFNALAQERDFYIEIIPKKTMLGKGEIFTAITSFMNVTQKEQKICSWTCSYDQNWLLEDSLNNFHLYGVNCEKNIVSCVTLKPFEKFEKELYLQVSDDAKKGKANFKLGFTPCVSREECFETGKESQQVFWSQETTVNIK
ncbi:MAG: hypothetical protein WC546_05370 [Candidatus Omnitrophota bacterium]